jgi:hypothetical protein
MKKFFKIFFGIIIVLALVIFLIPKKPKSTCGNGVCNATENSNTCSLDCRDNNAPSIPKVGPEISLNSPFGIHDPKVPSEFMKTIPAGYDLPKDVANAGAKWVRYAGAEGLVWDLVEKTPGQYDWSKNDYLISEAQKAGLNVIVVVNTFNKSDQPDVKMVNGAIPYGKPKNMENYLKFLQTAVERYDGDGVTDAPGSPVINSWEIENEVDSPIFWKDTPENYAQLLKESYKTIKKTNPNAQVSMAGMSDPNDTTKSLDFYFRVLAELDKKKDNPSAKYFNLAGLHLYNFSNNQLDREKVLMKAFKETLSKYGYNVPIWLTETGDYSGKPMRPPLKSEKVQAENLLKIYISSLSQNIGKIFWVTLTEWHKYAGLDNSVWDNVGLINNPQNDGDGSRKLSYFTYKKMTEILEGSDWKNTKVIQEKEGVYVYEFFKKNENIFVAWNESGSEKEISLPISNSNNVQVIETIPNVESGKEVKDFSSVFSQHTENNFSTLKLGNVPVYVISKLLKE